MFPPSALALYTQLWSHCSLMKAGAAIQVFESSLELETNRAGQSPARTVQPGEIKVLAERKAPNFHPLLVVGLKSLPVSKRSRSFGLTNNLRKPCVAPASLAAETRCQRVHFHTRGKSVCLSICVCVCVWDPNVISVSFWNWRSTAWLSAKLSGLPPLSCVSARQKEAAWDLQPLNGGWESEQNEFTAIVYSPSLTTFFNCLLATRLESE